MKILLVNAGSSSEGATARAVEEARQSLLLGGAEIEILSLAKEKIACCTGCGACKKEGKCVISDIATDFAPTLAEFDGFIFFTPTHYAGATGTLKSFMGRIFYSSLDFLRQKPCGAVSVSRRGGNVTALEEITRFFSFAEIITVSGNYPAILHGTSYKEADCDKEGLQTIRTLTKNMMWVIKCLVYGKRVGILPPKKEEKIKTPFIRSVQ